MGGLRYTVGRSAESTLALTRARARARARTRTFIAQLPPFDAASRARLDAIAQNVTIANAERVKAIERTTNHDLKAVEYYIKEACASAEGGPPPAQLQTAMEFVHFACTSEDVNNLAYGLMLRDAREHELLPMLEKVEAKLVELAHASAEAPGTVRRRQPSHTAAADIA